MGQTLEETVPRARRLELLAGVRAFGTLPSDALAPLADAMREVRFAPDDVVVREGDEGDRLFLIVEGRAEVTGAGSTGTVPLAALAAGEVFGEMALLDPSHQRQATVTAITPLALLELDAATFTDLMARHPAVREHVANAVETMRVARFLKLASPFTTLDAMRAESMAKRLVRVSVPAGAAIVRQGDPGDSCYLLRAGRAEVIAMSEGPDGPVERELGAIEPGTLFGEAALLTDAPRNATVRAAEPCELLGLRRADLLEIMGASQPVRDRMIELLRLRDRPRQVPGIVVHQRATPEGQTITTLKNPARGTYFRLSPQGWFLWQRLDGEHNLRDLALDYFVAFKAFSPDAITGLLAGLATAGFVQTRDLARDVAGTRATTTSEPPATGWWRAARAARRVLEWRVAIRHIDRYLDWIYGHVARPLYSRPARPVLAVLALAGLVAFVVTAARTGTVLARIGITGPLLVCLVLAYFLSIFIHEMGHALTVKSIGREVLSGGVGWYWYSPMAYIDTSDIWLATRRERIAVSLAGPYADALVGGVAALAALATGTTLLTAVLWQFAFVQYYSVLVNLNPLLEYDGYFVLMDALDRPNLRARCLRWLGTELPRTWRQPGVLRSHALELLFGLGAVLYILVMAAFVVLIYRLTVQQWLAHVLPVGVAAALAWVLALLIAGLSGLTLAGELRATRPGVGRRQR
jgi:putative peptide zinc metalloprotease protein